MSKDCFADKMGKSEGRRYSRGVVTSCQGKNYGGMTHYLTEEGLDEGSRQKQNMSDVTTSRVEARPRITKKPFPKNALQSMMKGFGAGYVGCTLVKIISEWKQLARGKKFKELLCSPDAARVGLSIGGMYAPCLPAKGFPSRGGERLF